MSMIQNKEIQKLLKTKQKIEKNPELVQPTAINEALIDNYLVTYNQDNKIFDRPDMKTWDLEHLALSYASK